MSLSVEEENLAMTALSMIGEQNTEWPCVTCKTGRAPELGLECLGCMLEGFPGVTVPESALVPYGYKI